jgi:hypothetical protein
MTPITPSLPNGSIFVPGLPRFTIPFPLIEAQFRLIRAVLSSSKPVILERDQQTEEVRQRYRELSKLTSNILGSDNVNTAQGNNKEDNGDQRSREKMGKIAILWHLLPENGMQFDYRAHLCILAGDETQTVERLVPDWQRRIHKGSAKLRTVWKDLERTGEAAEIVKGVGEGENAEDEWVKLMDQLLLAENLAMQNAEGIEHVPELI